MKMVNSQPPRDLQLIILSDDYEGYFGAGVFVNKELWIYEWEIDSPQGFDFYNYKEEGKHIVPPNWESLCECGGMDYDGEEIDLDEVCRHFEDKLNITLPLIAGLDKDENGKFIIKGKQYPNVVKKKQKGKQPSVLIKYKDGSSYHIKNVINMEVNMTVTNKLFIQYKDKGCSSIRVKPDLDFVESMVANFYGSKTPITFKDGKMFKDDTESTSFVMQAIIKK